MSEPFLPPEILRNIFEAAADDKNTARTLVAVCRATKEWIEPLLYKSLVILTSQAAAQIAMSINSHHDRDPSFFATRVKELTICWDVDEALMSVIFGACPGVNGLHIIDIGQTRCRQEDHTAIDAVERSVSLMRPTHVTLHDPMNPAHLPNALRGVSHLLWDLDGGTCCSADIPEGPSAYMKSFFPALTHFILPLAAPNHGRAIGNNSSWSLAAAMCETVLSLYPAIQVIVLLPYPYLVNTLATSKRWKADWVHFVEDCRCVHLLPDTTSNDPYVGFGESDTLHPSVIPTMAATEKEIWEFAERVIEVREREGFSIPSEYMVGMDRSCVIA
ncbi:hypothetical protein BDZ89DRAFT_1169142 [Hymenopellis radicata]|nr:hypothetical protein BDZ89DRAFT_1169142 [Hymenopellis radicata]